jgi:hypothetical protein
MKNLFLILAFVCLLPSSIYASNGVNKESIIYLNGEVLDLKEVWLNTKGVVTMVNEKIKSKKTSKLILNIYLKRNGKILNTGLPNNPLQGNQIELSTLLSFAQAGDELVIEPVQKEFLKSKKSVILNNNRFFFKYMNFFGNRNGDGC